MWAIHRGMLSVKTLVYFMFLIIFIISGIRPPRIEGCPKILTTLMQKCWAANTTDRPSMTQVVLILQRVLAKVKSSARGMPQNQNIRRLHSTEGELFANI